MLGRKKTTDEPTPTPTDAPEPEEQQSVGKGRPTPKRRDAEAANRKPLISGNPKADKQRAREHAAKQRRLMDEAMQTGDERYLPVQHKGVARRFARDYLDSRWVLGELFLPVALVVVLVMFAGSALGLPGEVIIIAVLAMYVIVFVALADSIVRAVIVRKRALTAFGRDHVRGLRLYVVMRAMQMRRMRLPKPQVKRGEYPTP